MRGQYAYLQQRLMECGLNLIRPGVDRRGVIWLESPPKTGALHHAVLQKPAVEFTGQVINVDQRPPPRGTWDVGAFQLGGWGCLD